LTVSFGSRSGVGHGERPVGDGGDLCVISGAQFGMDEGEGASCTANPRLA
jgi:hypothetical protein